MQDLRNGIAIRDKRIIELEEENIFLKGEIKGLAHRSKKTEEVMTTTDKFSRVLERRASGWIWYRDRILAPTLANLHTGIIVVLLIIVFRSEFIK